MKQSSSSKNCTKVLDNMASQEIVCLVPRIDNDLVITKTFFTGQVIFDRQHNET